jgi:hypothetical protein
MSTFGNPYTSHTAAARPAFSGSLPGPLPIATLIT